MNTRWNHRRLRLVVIISSLAYPLPPLGAEDGLAANKVSEFARRIGREHRLLHETYRNDNWEIFVRDSAGDVSKVGRVFASGSGSSYRYEDFRPGSIDASGLAYQVIELTDSGYGDATLWFAITQDEGGGSRRRGRRVKR